MEPLEGLVLLKFGDQNTQLSTNKDTSAINCNRWHLNS